MIRLLLIGSNPSTSSVDNSAFHKSTRSAKVLWGWLAGISSAEIEMINVCDTKTKKNKSLSVSDIKVSLTALKAKIDAIKPTHVVALGKTAEKALTLLQLNFYAMPHPSGCNRVCNDKDLIAEKIKGLELFVQSPSNVDLSCISFEERR